MPDIMLIPQIAKVFDISCDELLNGEVQQSIKNDDEERIICDRHATLSDNNFNLFDLWNKCKLIILVSVIGALISTLLLLFYTQATLIIGLIFSIAPLFALGYFFILREKIREDLSCQNTDNGNDDSRVINYKIYNMIFVLSVSALMPFIMLVARLNTSVFFAVQLAAAIVIIYFARIIISHILIKKDIIKPFSNCNYKKLNRIFIIIWAILILSFIVVCALGNISYFTTEVVNIEYECDSEADALEIEQVLSRLNDEDGISYRAVLNSQGEDYYIITLYSTIQDDVSYDFSISDYNVLLELYQGDLEYQLDGTTFYYNKVINIVTTYEAVYMPILAVLFLSLPVYAIIRKVGELKANEVE